MKKDIEHRKNHTLRFRPSDMKRWQNNAAKRRITLTEYFEIKLNARNNKDLFNEPNQK